MRSTVGTAWWLPRDARGRVQLVAAFALVVLAFAGSAAARVQGALADSAPAPVDTGVVTTASSSSVTPALAPADDHFTIGDLAAGRVPQEVQDRFWQAQLDAILAAPCPEPVTGGGTSVTLYLGADEEWTARLSEASADHRAACEG